jgi:phage-related baseplate assembly protein
MIKELQNLPEISFIDDMTIDEIQKKLVSEYENSITAITGNKYVLPKADKFRIIINSIALILYQNLQCIDRAGKQNTLKYAYGEYLDNKAAEKGVERKTAKAATVNVKFSLEAARSSSTLIPKGTRVSNDSDIYFETQNSEEIAAGNTDIVISCVCTEAGTLGNNIQIGEITTLVDPVAYISEVVNTTISTGGTDEEDDDSLRERVFLAPSSYTTTGSADAYIYHCKLFSNDIADVIATSDVGSAVVNIIVLLKNGVIPEEKLITQLQEYLNGDSIKTLTDKVVVAAPSVKKYDINLTYYINKSERSKALLIKKNVEKAIDEYILWQNSKIGRDINPDKLIEKIIAAGAKRIAISSPLYQACNQTEVPQLANKSITYGGIEDD